MNCSYRILENVHIGVRVRKTKDKKTVPYHNQPITDVFIKEWNDQGFQLYHEAFPTKDKTVWLDFYQLPLNGLTIEMGYIKNPIVFVEAIANYGGGTSMVFLRADTFDYLELLDDKKQKEESAIYKLSQLKPGERVISAICKEGNVMVYLGTFGTANLSDESWSYWNRPSNRNKYISTTPQAAFFAYEKPNGKFKIESYPVTNKVVKEFYHAADKGKGEMVEAQFTDIDRNMEMLIDRSKSQRYSDIPWNEKPNFLEKWPMILGEGYYNAPSYIQKEKKVNREEVIKYILENTSLRENTIFPDEKTMVENRRR